MNRSPHSNFTHKIPSQIEHQQTQSRQQTLSMSFFNFIKQLLQLLYLPQSQSHPAPIFSGLQTSQNSQVTFNKIPQETLAFLRQHRQGISKPNLTEVSYFIASNINLFESKQAMNLFLSETIQVKSFFVVLFQWMTGTPLVETGKQASNQEHYISWVKQPTQGQNKLKINDLQKLVTILDDIPRRWSLALDSPDIQSKLSKFSLMLGSQNSQDQVQDGADENDENYFFKLYKRIFINQERFGWVQLFNQKQIFNSIAKFRQNQVQSEKSPYLALPQNQSFKNRLRQKIQSLKKAFIYLHKYLLAKDIKQLKLSTEESQFYANTLPFQSYVPKKLGLSLEITLDYKEWFQVFFVEYNDNRPEVIEAACQLYSLVYQQSGKMLKTVKGLEFCHIKRLMYIATQKLESQKFQTHLNFKQMNQILQHQIRTFIQQNRVYESLLTELKFILESQFKHTTNLDSQKIRLIIEENYNTMPLDDMLPLLIAYLKYFAERKDSSNKVCVQMVKKMQKVNSIKIDVIFQNLSRIKGQARSKNDFLTFLKDLKEIKS